jgi:two-component system, LytTR family, sensor kinase
MNKVKIYWTYQIIGWTLWIANEALFYRDPEETFYLLVFRSAITIAAAIFISHSWRWVLNNYNWLNIPINALLFRGLLGVLIMGATLSFVNVSAALLLDKIPQSIPYQHYLSFQLVLLWSKPFLFWSACYYFYRYWQQKTTAELDKVKMESSLRENEAKVLRAQMNPHFMFNALNSIRALILEDPAKAQKGITQLSNILRSSLLADRRPTVTLSEELKTVDDYLALEKIRYEERLQVSKDIDPASLTLPIPPMLLQTLVENAIKHGVSKPIKGGFVNLKTLVEDGLLYIVIKNTGTFQAKESEGFGLENTAQRLKLIFGPNAHFNLQAQENNVVSATIQVPLVDLNKVLISKK